MNRRGLLRQFHATAVYASGGMVLSGDEFTRIPPNRLAMLRELLPPTGVAARFEDKSLGLGHIQLATRHRVCAFSRGPDLTLCPLSEKLIVLPEKHL